MNSRHLAVAFVLVSAVTQSSWVEAQAPYAKRATVYDTSLVRAMDECTGPGVTVVNPGAIVGCEQQNVFNGGSLDFDAANVKLFRTVDGIYIRMRAITSTAVGLQLRLRTTNEHGLPSGTSKTYEDFTIMCGDSTTGSEALVCPLHSKPFEGRVYLKQRLSDCLAGNGLDPSLGRGNVEVLGAALVSCDSLPVQTEAKPGILQKE
jgi:hypothetical protein